MKVASFFEKKKSIDWWRDLVNLAVLVIILDEQYKIAFFEFVIYGTRGPYLMDLLVDEDLRIKARRKPVFDHVQMIEPDCAYRIPAGFELLNFVKMKKCWDPQDNTYEDIDQNSPGELRFTEDNCGLHREHQDSKGQPQCDPLFQSACKQGTDPF